MSSLLPLLSVVLLGLIAGDVVVAQITTNATCLSNWQGLYNSRGQSPCLVGSYLGGACNGGQYDVGALEEDEHYIGPTTLLANECLCSSVMYAVMGGCSVCQNSTIISWLSWSANCREVFVMRFPLDIPRDTAVPGWAYDPISASGTFDPDRALADNSPERTGTLVQATNTGPTSSPSSTIGSGIDDGDDDEGTNTGAIAGGVVGGVVGAAILVLIGFFIYRRNKNKNANTVYNGDVKPNLTGTSYNTGGAGGMTEYAPVPYTPNAYGGDPAHSPDIYGGGSPPPAPSVPQPRLYDPDDPRTFPTAVSPPPVSIPNQSTGQSYTPSFPQPSTNTASSNQGMYRGVAEV